VVALIERECVTRRRCLEAEEFIHGVGLGQILGPFAVNTAFFIGYRLFGLWGGFVASCAFMVPSFFLVVLLSWIYFSFHAIPSLQGALAGVGPVVIALILNAAWTLGRKSVRTFGAALIAAAAALAAVYQINPIWSLGLAGLLGLIFKMGGSTMPPAQVRLPSRQTLKALLPVGICSRLLPHAGSSPTPSAGSLSRVAPAVPLAGLAGWSFLAWVFFKTGLIFFGGGFVLIPILHQSLVLNLGWLTQKEFLDGAAISQLTPGPIAVLATFAGYKLNGITGAFVATAALFAPAMVVMAIISHFYAQVHELRGVRHFLAGITPAVVGLVAAAALVLARAALHINYPAGPLLCLAFLFLLTYWKWPPVLTLLIGATIGIIAPGLLS
jgi:chromate transporter